MVICCNIYLFNKIIYNSITLFTVIDESKLPEFFYVRRKNMPNELYYRGSSTYEDAVKNQLKRIERNNELNTMAIAEGIQGVRSDIRESTYQIVASQAILAKVYKEGFDSVNNTLDFGFARIHSELKSLNRVANEICSKLDEIHDIVNNPLLTASRELYRRAVSSYDKGLFEEALEDVKQALEKNKTDAVSWLLLGQLYLYGASKFSNVINLHEAESSLIQAAKYIDGDLGKNTEADKVGLQIYYYLGLCKLYLSNDLLIEDKTSESNVKLEEAEQFISVASKKFDKKEPLHAEVVYENAKINHFLGKDWECLANLKQLIIDYPEYSVKACNDENLKSLWNEIENIIEELRNNLIEMLRKKSEELSAKYKELDDSSICNLKGYKTKDKLDVFISGLNNKDYLTLAIDNDETFNDFNAEYLNTEKDVKIATEHISTVKEKLPLSIFYEYFKFINSVHDVILQPGNEKGFKRVYNWDPDRKSDITDDYYENNLEFLIWKVGESSSWNLTDIIKTVEWNGNEYLCYDWTSYDGLKSSIKAGFYAGYNREDNQKKYSKFRPVLNDFCESFCKVIHTEYGDRYVIRLKVVLELLEEFISMVKISAFPELEGMEDCIKELRENLRKAAKKYNTVEEGCYIATSVYGSYDCPEVWTLRRFRDYKLAKTWYGRAFIHCYYAISPTLVKWFGKTKWFQKFWRSWLDKMVNNLKTEGFEDTKYDDLEW